MERLPFRTSSEFTLFVKKCFELQEQAQTSNKENAT